MSLLKNEKECGNEELQKWKNCVEERSKKGKSKKRKIGVPNCQLCSESQKSTCSQMYWRDIVEMLYPSEERK